MTAAALDIEDLANRYGPMVLRGCRRLQRDEEEAIDTCQDVLVRHEQSTFSLEKVKAR